ncbi:hypothetical protein HBI55_178000 [Parastagonospora nodorum]|nr:hypothetical protein HBI55_178000 [Parastagonospora nodorum]
MMLNTGEIRDRVSRHSALWCRMIGPWGEEMWMESQIEWEMGVYTADQIQPSQPNAWTLLRCSGLCRLSH